MRGYLTELIREHKHNLVHLSFLTDAAERIASRGINREDLELLDYSMKFLSKELGEHCRREEQLLYPQLRNYTDAMELLILSNEHDTIHEAMKMYEELVRCALTDSTSDGLALRLKQETRSFVKLLDQHIRREDSILLAAARKVLPEKEFSELFKDRTKQL